ncbi:DUF4097 family beta strand repeat-containing protein [Actinoplanes aureus]|jgi:DUF4097 and DUF4098 domain-containing protein YvlB|uniref:DUF4097 family beta strand repeat protein n=1 Tax=Actinoplanes aureus TaxID=2792083 RepID=A0A931CKS8_9ACTN|nr:DUF4097 family beta strand repeat-containing protein [Actinoplanes aureus]MBG0566755.1 DUF4097 family beta strand repeat protein [Actinoplanes aureus]
MPTFDTPGPITASVDLTAGELRVVASERPDTVVHVRPAEETMDRDVRAAEQTHVEFSLGTLTVRGPRQPGLGMFGKVGVVDVLVELPIGSDLEAKLGAGGVRCTGALGACRLRSGAGDLQVEQSETLSVSTGMGIVVAETVTGDARVTTGSGKLRVRSVSGPAVLKNGNGEVWVGHAGSELRINSANGDIAADHAGGSVTASTANGDIRMSELVRGSATLRSGAGRIEIGIRQGTAARLDVHTHYGRIRNEMTATDGPVETDEQAEVRARTGFGDILIRRS